METITTHKDFVHKRSIKTIAKELLRDNYLRFAQLNKNISDTNNWVRFPLYHHVFDDEKRGFERQLKYLKNFGDFVSIDEAAELIGSGNEIDGRYFCVTFDDGFQNCYSNMMDITASLDVPVIIYVPSDWLGLDKANPEDEALLKTIMPENPRLPSFLNAAECKEMMQHKISFGTHTCGHVNLGKLSAEEIERELKESKRVLDKELGIDCQHFAVPWGKIDVDYPAEITEKIAKKLGYKTVVATNRGKNFSGDNLFQIKRDHLLANWGNYQIKYFFSL